MENIIQSDLETRSGYYKYVPNPDPFDFMALRENLEQLIQIDRQQKELNMLVGQSFWVETQEGKAVYQIISVKPFEWKIKVVYGLGNWDVVYPEWGEEKWIDAKEGVVINNSLTVGMFS